MTDTNQKLGLWIPQVTGRYLNEDWNPTNEGFGAQCWDAAANWSKYLGLPVISTGGKGRWPGWAGNIVDAFPQSPAIAAAYELVSPDAAGQPGDIAVWGDGYYYYPKTHVAVLVRDLSAQLLCISQNSSASLPGNPYPNWTTGPTILQHLPRRGLIGFIRPRGGGLAAQGAITQEEYEVITDADVDRIAKAAVALIMTEQHGGNTLGELISEERDHHTAVIETVEKRTTNITIHPVQAEGIVSSTVERLDTKLNGRTIDAGQADDIAQAAARYNQQQDTAKDAE